MFIITCFRRKIVLKLGKSESKVKSVGKHNPSGGFDPLRGSIVDLLVHFLVVKILCIGTPSQWLLPQYYKNIM